jgi:serralysin
MAEMDPTPVDTVTHTVGCACCANTLKFEAPSIDPVAGTTGGDTIPGSTATTETIAIGGSRTGVINSLGDHDYFSVQLVAGQSYVFVLDGSGALDAYLNLRSSTGTIIASNDDGGGNLDSRITFTATTSGTYYLDAGAYNNNSSGSYTLSASAYTPPSAYTNDQIAQFLTVGYWGGTIAHWTPGSTITYNVTGLTAAAATLARDAFAFWSDVANLTFVETTGTGQITVDDAASGAYASSSSSGGVTTSAIINVQQNWSGESNPGRDSYTYQTFLHEIGHTLGLGHGGPYNGSATYGSNNIYPNDTWSDTVMSYFSQNNYEGGSYRFVQTGMAADILAVQQLYGARATSRAGDTTYGHNSNAGYAYSFSNFSSAPAFTIWDGGGTDTLNASLYSANQTINLTSEIFSNIGGLTRNINIARGAVIENAVGGSGSDTINGNGAGNVLTGGLGSDVLSGLGGSDVLYGGDGQDTISYAGDSAAGGALGVYVDLNAGFAYDGFSTADYFSSVEIVVGTNSLLSPGLSDALLGDNLANTFYGAGGLDYIVGNGGNDTIDTGAGATGVTGDIVVSGTGNDTVTGGDGATFIYGNDGSDTLYGGNGEDWLFGGDYSGVVSGADFLYGGAGADVLTVGTAGGSATMDGGAGNDIIYGGVGFAGSDTLIGGTGSDYLYSDAGTDTFRFNNGDLVVGDFDQLAGFGAGDTLSFATAYSGQLQGSNQVFNGVSGTYIVSTAGYALWLPYVSWASVQNQIVYA